MSTYLIISDHLDYSGIWGRDMNFALFAVLFAAMEGEWFVYCFTVTFIDGYVGILKLLFS